MIPALEDTVSKEDLEACNCEQFSRSLDIHIIVSSLQKYEYTFNKTGSPKSKFDYALCLLRSPYKADMQKASLLLNELLSTDEQNERDYLFHLSVVHTRLHEYVEAERYCIRVKTLYVVFLCILIQSPCVPSLLSPDRYANRLYQTEPNNAQVATLKSVILEKRNSQAISDVATLSVVSVIAGIAIFLLRGVFRA